MLASINQEDNSLSSHGSGPAIEMKPITPAGSRGFISYIHNFRGVAIIFVVAGHLLLDWAENSLVHQFLMVFWENGTVLFVFIAGYLFQYLSSKFVYRDYLKKKLQYVLLPYLIISIPIILLRLYQSELPGNILINFPQFQSWPLVQKVGAMLVTGAHMQQFWFIPMITIFYVIAPLLLFIDKHPRLYWILLLLIPVSLLTDRSNFNAIFLMFLHFLSVYVFGMLMSRYKNRYLEIVKNYSTVLIIATVATFTFNLYFYQFNNALNYSHKMLFCCFFIFLLWKQEKQVPAFIGTLATISFGIFFVHYYVILLVKGLFEFVFHRPVPGNLLAWLIYLVVVLILSAVFVKAVQRFLPRYSKNLVGC